MGRGWHRRQVDPRPRSEIRDQGRLPGRHGHDPGPPPPHPAFHPVAAGDELGGLEEGIEVVADDHAHGRERSVGCPRLAGQRARVGDGGRLRLLAAADLDGHHGLAELEGTVGQGEEPLGALEALNEQDHRLGLVVVDRVGQEVAHVEHDLAAAADDPREPDPVARVEERVRDRARLGDARHPATRQPRVDVADVRRAVRRQVDQAHAVGAEEGDPVADGQVADVALHLGGGRAALDDAAARDDDRRHAGGGRIGDDRRRTEGVDGDEDRVGDLGQVGDRRIAGLAVELVVARVDEVTARRAVDDPEVVADRLGDPATGRCAHDRDRARGEERPQVDRRRGRERGGRHGLDAAGDRRRLRHPTTRPTPRFSSALATISRWISDVPSQIRSTRSSRR